jgi:hypothetical protein
LPTACQVANLEAFDTERSISLHLHRPAAQYLAKLLPACLPACQVANLEAFDTERSITLVPPDGEFALANYRTSHALRLPFRLSITTESDPASDHKVQIRGRAASKCSD